MAVMDILIKATDQASDVIENVSKKGAEAGSWLEQNWAAVGAASAAAGVGIEAAARAQAPLTEQTQRLAASLDMTEGEMRELALATSDVTLPLDDVLGLMETGAKRGLDSAEALKEYALNWDKVGDATGLSATALAESGVALQQLGISAGQEGEAMAAFGYITENTTGGVDEFLNFIERAGPELNEMGLDVNDTAALMGVLENEMGLTGRMARQEFREAVNSADGSVEEMMKTLGITEEQFDSYSKKVEESSDIIDRNADIHADSYTVMEKAQHFASELAFKYGDLIGMASNLAPVLMLLGPLIKGISAAKGVMAFVTSGSLIPALSGAIASAWAFTAALLANPITWIVLLIVGLIAAIVLLWKNWDEVSAWFVEKWDWIKEKAGEAIEGIVEWLSKLPGRIWEWLVETITKFLEWRAELREKMLEIGKTAVESFIKFLSTLPGRIWEWLVTTITKFLEWRADLREKMLEAGRNAVESFIEFIRTLPARAWEWLKATIDKVITFARETVQKVRELAGDIKKRIDTLKADLQTLWNDIKTFAETTWNNLKTAVVTKAQELYTETKAKLEELWKHIKEIPAKAITWGKNIIQGLISGILGMAGTLKSSVTRFINNNIPKVVQELLGLASPSRLMMKFGGHVAEGLSIGISSGAARVSKSTQSLVDAAKNRFDTMVGHVKNTVNAVSGEVDRIEGLLSEASSSVGGSRHRPGYIPSSGHVAPDMAEIRRRLREEAQGRPGPSTGSSNIGFGAGSPSAGSSNIGSVGKGDSKEVHYHFHIDKIEVNNPVPEKGSTSIRRELLQLRYLGGAN